VHSAVNNLIQGTRLALFVIPKQGVLGRVSVSRRLLYIYIYILICMEVCPGCSGCILR